jgi:hypothetical protein
MRPLLWNDRIWHHYLLRETGDGREIAVVPLSYGKARLTIGPAGEPVFDDAY